MRPFPVYAFHEALVGSAGSARLSRAARTVFIETRMCLGALQTTYPDILDQVREHVDLREAIGSGAPALARTLLLEHMRDAITRLGGGPH
jgi:DNA-binding GntR family transcriptional regulator